LRFVYVLEFGDAEALGRIAEYRSDFFGRGATNPMAPQARMLYGLFVPDVK